MSRGDKAVIPSNYTVAIGLTKREYFAAMAMQGICASPFAPDIKNVSQAMASDVKNAVKMADALLAELKKPHD